MKRLGLILALLVVGVRAEASDARTPAFLRAYVKALCAEKAGNHDAAVAEMKPFIATWGDMKASANATVAGQYVEAANSAAAALLEFAANTRHVVGATDQVHWQDVKRTWTVSGRDRKKAVTDLEVCFGPSVVDGAKEGPPDLDAVAAAFAEFLMRDPNRRLDKVDMRFHIQVTGYAAFGAR